MPLALFTMPGRAVVLASFLAVALLAGCATTPVTFVNTDPQANFSSYKTYGFLSPLGTDNSGYSSVLSQFLRTATAAQMEARGYTQSASPDLLINFNVQTKDKIQTNTLPSGMGYGGGYYGFRNNYYGVWGGYQTTVTEYTEGTLTVDVVDSARKQLAWEGTVVNRVTSKDRQNLQPLIERGITQVFTKYPYRAPAAP